MNKLMKLCFKMIRYITLKLSLCLYTQMGKHYNKTAAGWNHYFVIIQFVINWSYRYNTNVIKNMLLEIMLLIGKYSILQRQEIADGALQKVLE